MLFNSFHFLLFFPLVVILYYALPHKWRWALLLAASYYFYMCWKVEYVFIIMFSTGVDFIAAHKIHQSIDKKKKKGYLLLSILVNVGLLFSFKYYNFVNANITNILDVFDLKNNLPYFNFLLPVGISFYTFQTLSYTIDVYRGKIMPEKHFGYFALFVTYFPQLVAGPIERSRNLLPQLKENKKLTSDNIVGGLKLMAWGFFKKLVIADRCAFFVDEVYNNIGMYHGFTIIVASILFIYQIYCDFSGYSDIAIGTARLMGVKLMLNFDRPFSSKSISELWRRWHISLSSWVNDYLFLPISRKFRGLGKIGIAISLVLSFFLMGLWHGADWTFIFFGVFNGFIMVYEIYTRKTRRKWRQKYGGFLYNKASILLTMTAFIITGMMFRSNSTKDLFVLFQNLSVFDGTMLIPEYFRRRIIDLLFVLFYIVLMEVAQYFQKDHEHFTDAMSKEKLFVRWPVYIFLLFSVLKLGVFSTKEYIYFQF